MEKLYSFLYVPKMTNITRTSKINNEQLLGYIPIISAKSYIANFELKINEDDINSLLLRQSKKVKILLTLCFV